MLQATRRTVAEIAELPSLRGDSVLRIASYAVLVAAVVLFVVVAVRASAVLQSKTAIASLLVEGEMRNGDRGQIAARVAPVAGGSYFSADLAAIRDAALAAPWVDEVIVSRRWPDGVRLQVREMQPVALWGAGGLLSSRGDLFVPANAVSISDLPILFGPANKTVYVMEQYRAMNGILRGLGMRIVELQLTERMSWFLRLDNGMELVVDQVDAIEKMQRFAYLYERQLKPDAGSIATIDLRYRNGVAVGWKNSARAKPAAQRS